MKYRKVDLNVPDILKALEIAVIYKKQGNVIARRAAANEEVETVLADGTKETVNTAKDGDWIVTNPSGEKYIISEEKFLNRYYETNEEGTFAAKGYCRAIRNPFNEPIEIMASWGSPQFGDSDCLIADICDENGDNMGGAPYLIDGDAFAETYKALNEISSLM